MVIIAPSSPASTDPDTESGGKMQLIVKSRPSDQIKRKAMRVLSLPHLVRAFFVVWTVKRKSKRALAESAQVADAILQLKKKRRLEKALATSKRILAKLRLAADARKKNTCTLVGHIDPVGVVHKLQKNCGIEIFSGDLATARSDPFPATMRITELQPIEDTDLERKRSLGILRAEEQLEQSEKRQEDQPPPGQADSYISQVEASSLSHPLPPLSLPLASKARPSSSPISRPTFPFAPSSSCMFWNESLVDMPAHSSISGGVCLPKDMKLMEKGLEAHDQLYDSAVHHLLSGIDGIGELKRHYDLRAGEQASRLKEADDTAIMLRKQVEELEAKLSMANMPERRLMDMVRISQDGHARTKRELALVREKMDEANCRIDYLEAAVSRYQDRIVAAEIEKEKTEERASRASVKGETMSTPDPQPSGSKEYLPEFCSFTSPGPYLTDLAMCKESVLFPGCDLLYGQPLDNKRI